MEDQPEVKQRVRYPFDSIEVEGTFTGKGTSLRTLSCIYNKKLHPKKFVTETIDGTTWVKRVA